MVKQIIISNLKRKITSTEHKRIVSLAKSITSDKDSIESIEAEYPQLGIREVRFDVDIEDNLSIVYFLFYFLEFLQRAQFNLPKGEWFSIKCGIYNIMIKQDGKGKPIYL